MSQFFDSVYLTLSFAVCINTSHVWFTNASISFNNVYGIIISIALVFGPIFFAKKIVKALLKIR